MNSADKKRIEQLIRDRVNKTANKVTSQPMPKPTKAEVATVQAAVATAMSNGWDVTIDRFDGRVRMVASATHPVRISNQETRQAATDATQAVADEAIVSLWTTGEFDIAAWYKAIDSA